MNETHVAMLVVASVTPLAYWIGLFVGRIRHHALVERQLQRAVEEMERELRAAEIRLHDVAAHCANVEAELAEIKPAKPVTAQVQLNDSEMEMIARAHGTGGWQTLDDMVRFARAIETASLRANGFDIQPPKAGG